MPDPKIPVIRITSLSLLVACGGMSHGRSAMPAPAPIEVAEVDSMPISPLHFEKSIVLETEFLERIAEESRLARATAEAAEIQQYVERYGISEELARTIREASIDEGLDPELAFRLVRTESRFNPRARGPQGALGLVQLMPATARWLNRSLRTEAQILDPEANLRTGFSYLRELIQRYDGDVRLGLLAYNRGEGAVNRALKRGRDPENGYSKKVLGTNENRYLGDGLIVRRQAVGG